MIVLIMALGLAPNPGRVRERFLGRVGPARIESLAVPPLETFRTIRIRNTSRMA